jgi:hypothetical protein
VRVKGVGLERESQDEKRIIFISMKHKKKKEKTEFLSTSENHVSS